MNPSEMKNNEKKLIALKAGLLDRINLLDRDKMRISTPLPENLEDQAVIYENDEVVDTLSRHDEVELKSVNDALKRIELGIFGICTSCGKEMEKKRLNAIPYAVSCIECEDAKL